MEVTVGHIDDEKIEHCSGRETNDSHDAVQQSEEDQEPAGGELTGTKCEEAEETAYKVDDIESGVDFEHEEHAFREKSGDTSQCEDQSEQSGERLNESVHEAEGRK